MSRLSSLFLGKETASDEVSESAVTKQKYAILFVDDEENVLKSMQRIFRRENYATHTASDGEKALEIMANNSVQVVVSDYKMPGMTGAELLTRIKQLWPATIRIMLTGNADVNAVMGAVNEGAVYKFITKPWNDDDLRLTVSLALEQYDLIHENTQLREQQKQQSKKISQLKKFVNSHRSQLGSMLLKKGKITQTNLDKVLAIQAKTDQIMPVILVDIGVVDEKTMRKVIEVELGINSVDLGQFHVPAALASLFPKEMCFKNLIIPLKRTDGNLIVAMGDPTDYVKIDDLKFIAGMPVKPVFATLKEITAKIKEVYGEEDEILETEFDISDPTETIEIILDEDDEDTDLEELLSEKDKPPAIRIVNAIISDALRHGASDVHIEPKTKYTMIRYRIDGLLHDKIHVPIAMHQSIISRIKIMSELDIAERRRPQDGRITVKSSTKMVDMRLSTLPTINGEKVVLRILDRNAAIKELSGLGMSGSDLVKVTQLIQQPQGCILSTGPTGSGKTSTLYSLLQQNATITKNFTTIEDPVEYFMSMAEQVMIKEKIGLGFSAVLRSILRQDPNVIMLGEIRDFETAEIAFQAALTGHMVLSTLHTNGSVASITRLRDMGIQPYVLCDALIGIVAQRLVRRLCENCKQAVQLEPEILKSLKINPEVSDFSAFNGKGCDQCNGSGYQGRIGIFEVFQINGEIKQLIHQGADEHALNSAAKLAGMKTLLEDARDKIQAGLTSYEEVIRVLGPQNTLEIICPYCSKLLLDRHNFCTNCGGTISPKCSNCGSFMEMGWNACPACGTMKNKTK